MLKTCILENYLPGVSVRDTSGAESNSLKFTLAGKPWNNHGEGPLSTHGAGLHAKGLLVHLFAAAINLGFEIAASADVSSAYFQSEDNPEFFPYDVHSIFLVKMSVQDLVPAKQIPDPDLKLHRSGFPSRYPLEEDHLWVWSVEN